MYLSIIILPLLGSIVSGFFGRKVGVSGAQLITCSSVIITTVLAIFTFFEVGFNNIPVTINLFRWIDSEWYNIIWGFQFDSLTVYFAGILIDIEAVLVLIQLYKKIFNLNKFCMLKILLLKQYDLKSSYDLRKKTFRPSCFSSLRNQRMSYSTFKSQVGSKGENLILPLERSDKFFNLEGFLDSKFLEWLVGFADAEANFFINPILKKDKITISSFSFMFKIGLHKDDEKVLRYIKDKLGVGGVRLYKDECIYNVTDKNGILLLISIFDKYNLNTSKYLDYLAFREAFFYYLNRDKNLNADSVKIKILELKNKMNTNRIDFNRPENSKIVITKNWLLGFIEGDGSFFLRRDNLTPILSIENTGVQLPVLLKIKEFLENSLGFDTYSLYKIKNSSIILITTIKAKSINSKSSVSLTISNINVLNNYLLPFFSDMEFLTKKGKDFNDFKIICKAIYEGAHRKEEIRSLILNLSNTMNNFRLSTYKGEVEVQYLDQEKLEKLLCAAPTIERLIDGRVRDKDTKKILPKQTSCIYEIFEKDGEFILANSLVEAASIVGVYPDTLSKYLDIEILNPEEAFVEIKNYKVRRVRVFSSIK